MAKKALHIIIVLLLNFSLAGIVVHKHYSNGHLFDTALYQQADTCCAIPCDCCDDETQVFQLKPDFIGNSTDLPVNQVLDLMVWSEPFCHLGIFGLDNLQITPLLPDSGPPNASVALLQVFRC